MTSITRFINRKCRIYSSLRRVRRFSVNSVDTFVVDNPYSGDTFCTVPSIKDSGLKGAVEKAVDVQHKWGKESLDHRISVCERFVLEMDKMRTQIATEITGQMGKPISQSVGEVSGCITRAKAMISLAHQALDDEIIPFSDPTDSVTFERKISHEPIGVVLCLAPWNYPLLCAVNVVIPAVLAGNSVLLKHSSRTPLCSQHFQQTFENAGAPSGLLQAIQSTHSQTERLIADKSVSYVSFTGSVSGGRHIQKAAVDRFIGVGLELGGKDPAYIHNDVDVAEVAASVVDGAMYNAGQSCCAVERAYVHEDVYDEFLSVAKSSIDSYILGDPLLEQTTMGPLAQHSGEFLSSQVRDALQKGARLISGGSNVNEKSSGNGRFFEPTLLADCSHLMEVMKEETFGPILPVMKVRDDEEAIQLMNDSEFGLTASVWTNSSELGFAICSEIDSGTVYMNRCDVLDPHLPWSGRKDSGKGCSLSHLGFTSLTKTKSYNFRMK